MTEVAPPVTVVVRNELDEGDPEGDIDDQRWQELARRALITEGVEAGELTLVFIGTEAMAELNAVHMGGEGPTDVLAFPIDATEPPGAGGAGAASGGPPVLLGDVVVCPAVARVNAEAQGRALDDEIALLVVHGVLHVLGHDHAQPDEASRMQAREQALLRAHHRP